MSDKSVKEIVLEVVSLIYHRYHEVADKHKEITENSKFLNDLVFDSYDYVEAVMAIEEALDMEISDDIASTWVTVNDAIVYIENKRAFGAK